MSLVDVAIPGIIGLVLLVWPQPMFLGARVSPDAKKVRLLRWLGALLLLVAAGFLLIKAASA
jgi:hypothetical protein